MEEYKYRLQEYRGSSSRHTCPSCGHHGEFTLYIDTTTGIPLSPKCGRCNRAKCGYHCTPSMFFKDNPSERPEQTEWKEPIKIEPPRPQSFLPTTILEKIQPCRHRNALHNYLCSIFDEQDVNKAFDRYFVGTSKHWRIGNYLSCVFPQIDKGDRVCQLKVMAYNPETGKRLHKEHPCEQWDERLQAYRKAPNYADRLLFLGKRIMGADANLRQCFFGQHLLKDDAKLVGVVESEKTALVASISLPMYTWLASGGKNGVRFTPEQLEVLKGRRVVLFSDEDAIGEWENRAKTLQSYGIDASVSRICEGKGSHIDIGDLIVENQLRIKKQKQKPMTIGELCEMMHDMNFPKERVKINV